MNKFCTLFIFLLFISFTSTKADFDGDSTAFQFNDPGLFSAEISDEVSFVSEGINLIVNDMPDKGIKIIFDALTRLRLKTKAERMNLYQPTEFYSILYDLNNNGISENEREIGILFLKKAFTTINWSFDKTIDKYLRKNPNSLFINRVRLLFSTYFLMDDELEVRIKNLLSLYPDLLSVNIAQAEFCYNARDFQQSIMYFRKTIALFPDYACGYKYIGLCYKELDQTDSVLQNYSKAILLFPKDAVLFKDRGNAWMNLKQYDSSLADYRNSIRINPKDAWAYNNIALSYRYMNLNDSALYYFNKAIGMSNKTAQFFDNRGDFYFSLDNYQKAILDYSRSIDLEPMKASYYVDRGDAYFYDEETDQAIWDFTKATQLSPNYSYAHKRTGDCYYEKKYFKQAVAYYQKAIEIDSSYIYAYIQLGLSYNSLEDHRLEIEAYKNAMQLDSVNESVVGNLGWAYYCANDFDSCILYSQKAIRYDDKAYYAKFNIALATLRMGKTEQAKALYVTYLDQFNKIGSDDPEISGGPVGAKEDLHNLLDKNIQVDEVNDILKNIFGQ